MMVEHENKRMGIWRLGVLNYFLPISAKQAPISQRSSCIVVVIVFYQGWCFWLMFSYQAVLVVVLVFLFLQGMAGVGRSLLLCSIHRANGSTHTDQEIKKDKCFDGNYSSYIMLPSMQFILVRFLFHFGLCPPTVYLQSKSQNLTTARLQDPKSTPSKIQHLSKPKPKSKHIQYIFQRHSESQCSDREDTGNTQKQTRNIRSSTKLMQSATNMQNSEPNRWIQ